MTPPRSDGRPTSALVGRLTPIGQGGIGVVEVAGPDAAAILNRLFVSPRNVRVTSLGPGRLAYGRLWREGQLLDEVIIECIQRLPQGVYAINCHGGAVAFRRVSEALVAEGAQPATWSSLLQRRRDMGTLDAIQCEAAERIPDAPTLRAARVLLDQYRGALTSELREIRAALSQDQADEAGERLQRLLAGASYGLGLSAPLPLAIIGRPNVGKSTIGNALLRHDRLIVHHEPGTTRDTVEEILSLDGLPFLLMDTAGMRVAQNEIESEGVQRSRETLEQAGLVLLVFDVSAQLTAEDRSFLPVVRGKRIVPVLILNKCDLPGVLEEDALREAFASEPVRISALTGAGLDALERRILERAYPDPPPPGAPVCFTQRQQRVLNDAFAALAGGDLEQSDKAVAGLS